MKRICSAALCVLLLLCFTGTVSAAQTVGYELNMPSQAAVNKSVTVNIMLACAQECDLGAMLFMLEYDQAVLTYREAKLSAGAPGELRSYAENGKLKIVYLNTAGTTLRTNPRELISVRFTAPAGECKTSLVLSGSQPASAQEQRLSYVNPIGYEMSILEKPDANPAPAKGTRQKTASSGGAASSSKGNTTSKTTGSADGGGYIDPWSQGWENGTQDGVLSAGGEKKGDDLFENNGFLLFLCGLAAAAVLFGLVFGAYRLGAKKKQGALKAADGSKHPAQAEMGEEQKHEPPEEEKQRRDL